MPVSMGPLWTSAIYLQEGVIYPLVIPDYNAFKIRSNLVWPTGKSLPPYVPIPLNYLCYCRRSALVLSDLMHLWQTCYHVLSDLMHLWQTCYHVLSDLMHLWQTCYHVLSDLMHLWQTSHHVDQVCFFRVCRFHAGTGLWPLKRFNKQRYLMPEGINARVSRYYICWHSITCYTFVQQLEICN